MSLLRRKHGIRLYPERTAIFFTPQRHALFFEACDEDEQTLSAHNWTRPTCEAFRCARCQKIIIDYSSDEAPKTKNCLYDFFFRRTK